MVGLFASRRRVAAVGLLVLAAAALFSLQDAQAVPGKTPAQLQVELTLAPREGLKPRIASPKPEKTKAFAGLSKHILQVKFKQGSLVRLRNGKVTSLGSDDLSGVHTLAARYPGMRFSRLIEQPELAFAQDRARLEAKTGEEMPDLNLWYKVHLPAGATAAKVSDEFNALSLVEIAYPEPLPEPNPGPPPGATPNYTDRQDYKLAAGDGIDSFAAYTLPAGSGYLAKIFDIEYGWNVNHEDLAKARAPGATILNGTPVNPFNNNDHGTAVLGELVADNNGFGVTGISPGSAIRMINQRNTGGDARVNAINLARLNALAGDVVLLEMQTVGPNGGCSGNSQVGCAPVEWVAGIYDAIKLTTASDIYVVEAAGNGSQNLDGAEYKPWRDKGPSLAFIVGAGGSNCYGDIREKLSFSNYGSMIHLQGWGECVATTGYGTLQGSSQSNDAYTGGFSGTSSASPIVAGAVAQYSSVVQFADGDNLVPSPGIVLFILAFTSTPQVTPPAGQIGGLPNLRKALRTYDNVKPFLPSLALSDQSRGNFAYTNGLTDSTVSGFDNFEVEEYYVSESGVTPAANAAGWTTDPTTTVTISGADGVKTLFAWTKDTNDNISPRTNTAITLDTVLPITTFTAPATSNTAIVPVTLSATDEASGVNAYYVKQDATPPLETDAGWTSQPPTTFTLTGANGPQTLYAWSRDNTGNISAVASATVIFDDVKPTTTLSAPETTKIPEVPITITGTDTTSGVAAYYVREGDATTPAVDDPGWTATAPATVTVSATSGSKTLYGWTKDVAGNISDAATVTVLFDNVKPTVTIDEPVANSSQRFLRRLAGSTVDDLTEYRFADFTISKRLKGGMCAYWHPIQHKLVEGPCNTPMRFLIKHVGNLPDWTRRIGKLDVRGKYLLVVRYVDAAGNIGRAKLNFSITPAPGTPPGDDGAP